MILLIVTKKAGLYPISEKQIFGRTDFLGLKMRVSFNFVLSKINYLYVAAVIITELESSDIIMEAFNIAKSVLANHKKNNFLLRFGDVQTKFSGAIQVLL